MNILHVMRVFHGIENSFVGSPVPELILQGLISLGRRLIGNRRRIYSMI